MLDDMRRAIYAGIKPQVQPQQNRVENFVTNALRGRVYARVTFVNVLGVEIPSASLERLASHPDVARISVDHEGHPELYRTAEVIGADHFWDFNYKGDGTWDVAVVDSGVHLDHPALSDHRGPIPIGSLYAPFISVVEQQGEQNNPLDNYGHGTAVAGIIACTPYTYDGREYKGIAYGIDKILVCKVMAAGYDPREIEVWDAVDWALD